MSDSGAQKKQQQGRRRARGGRRKAPPPLPEGLPGSLAELAAALRRRAEGGESQEMVISYLGSVAAPLGIRVRYDEHIRPRGGAPAPEAPEAPKAPEAPEAPKAPKAPEAPEAPEAPGAPEAPEAPEAAKAPEGAKAPEAPKAPAEDENFPALGAVGGTTPPKAPRARGARGRTQTNLPVSINRGRVVVGLEDPALQEKSLQVGEAFEGEQGAFVGRVHLSCDRGRSRDPSLLGAECNGAVLDARTWTVLATPPRSFAPRLPAEEVNRALAQEDEGEGAVGAYDVIQVSDGTVATLYCWDHPARGPIWSLASCNGYDISHLRWMGPKTFAEILHELLGRVPGFAEATGLTLLKGFLCEGDCRLGFGALDRSRSYTVGFRHGNLHPMAAGASPADPPAVWGIQAAAGGVPLLGAGDGLPGVPRQATFTRADLLRLAKKAPGAPLELADLEEVGRGALEEARAVLGGQRGGTPLPRGGEGVHVSPLCYGFILRSRDPAATGRASDVICETPLLRRVRQLVYQRPPRDVREELDEKTRLDYGALRAFLSATDREDYLALFPGVAAPRFAVFRSFVDNVIHQIVLLRRRDTLAPGPPPPGERPDPGGTRTKAVAKTMLAHLLHYERDFKVSNPNSRSIIHDFVVRPEYATTYLKALAPLRSQWQ